MAVKIVEGEKPYTGGTGIEITANKVINLLLREANNLIKVNANNEVYTDLQMAANTAFALNNIEVGVTVGRVSAQDGWTYTGTVLAYKTASGSTNMILYADNGNLYFFNGTNWVQIYTKPQIDAFVQELRDEMELLRQEIIALIPTKTSDLDNDSGFITVAVTGLTNYYDKTTIDQFLNLKADKTALTDGLNLKVDKATTYEMTNLNLNEAGVMSESFSNQALSETMQVIKHALSTLYDGKASATATTQALTLKADITYVDDLVASSLGLSTKVVEELPVTGQGNYIYLVPVSGQQNVYTKYVWNAETQSYVNLGSTNTDLSNAVTLDGTQTITGLKTFSVEPILPNKVSNPTNSGTAPATEAQVHKVASDLSSFESSASNTYATKTELNNAITGVEGGVGAGNITLQVNSSTSGITNSTFGVNQGADQTVNITVNKATVGLSNVDNTSDANKPVSTAQASAIAGAVSALADTMDAELDNKQDTLVSGTNIKTVNGNSLLGTGNLEISGLPSGGTAGQILTKTANGADWEDATPPTVSVSTGQSNLTIWRGTQTEYDAITTKDSNTLYIVGGGVTLKSFDEIYAMSETAALTELNTYPTEYYNKFNGEGLLGDIGTYNGSLSGLVGYRTAASAGDIYGDYIVYNTTNLAKEGISSSTWGFVSYI